jgi:hypothetical protein
MPVLQSPGPTPGSNSKKASGGEAGETRAKAARAAVAIDLEGRLVVESHHEPRGTEVGIEGASTGGMLVVKRQQVVEGGLSCLRAGGRGSSSRKVSGTRDNRCQRGCGGQQQGPGGCWWRDSRNGGGYGGARPGGGSCSSRKTSGGEAGETRAKAAEGWWLRGRRAGAGAGIEGALAGGMRVVKSSRQQGWWLRIKGICCPRRSG